MCGVGKQAGVSLVRLWKFQWIGVNVHVHSLEPGNFGLMDIWGLFEYAIGGVSGPILLVDRLLGII